MNPWRRAPAWVVGVDVAATGIRTVTLPRDGAAELLSPQLGYAALPADAVVDGEVLRIETTVAALRQALSSSGHRARQAVLGLPSSQLLQHHFSVPAGLSENDQARLVEAEVAQRVAFAPQDAVFDFGVDHGAVAPDGQQMLWLVAAQRQRVESRVALARQAGLQVVAVDSEALAAARAVAQSLPARSFDAGRSPRRCVLLQGHAHDLLLQVLESDRIVHSQTLRGADGGPSLAAHAAGLPTWASPLLAVWSELQDTGTLAQVDRVWVGGALAMGAEVSAPRLQALAHQLGLPCRLADPLLGWRSTRSAQLADHLAAPDAAAGYLQACGLALHRSGR